MQTAPQQTNSLKFSTKKVIGENTIYVDIRLNDECKNGHADFAITGSIYKGDSKADREFITGGCIHEEILKAFPEFKPFVNLHLCDQNGAPMYAAGNGFYWLRAEDKTPAEREQIAKEYLRLTDAEFTEVNKAEDELHLKYILYNLGIVDRWKVEAEAVTKALEDLTGMKYTDSSTRANITPLTKEETATIKDRIKSGYYSEKQKEARKKEARAAQYAEDLEAITITRDEKTEKANREFAAKKVVLDAGVSLKNFIFYTHSNEACFNWLSYAPKVTEEELQRVKELAANVPEIYNVTFKFSDNK